MLTRRVGRVCGVKARLRPEGGSEERRGGARRPHAGRAATKRVDAKPGTRWGGAAPRGAHAFRSAAAAGHVWRKTVGVVTFATIGHSWPTPPASPPPATLPPPPRRRICSSCARPGCARPAASAQRGARARRPRAACGGWHRPAARQLPPSFSVAAAHDVWRGLRCRWARGFSAGDSVGEKERGSCRANRALARPPSLRPPSASTWPTSTSGKRGGKMAAEARPAATRRAGAAVARGRGPRSAGAPPQSAPCIQ
jgi:hypothetical protein